MAVKEDYLKWAELMLWLSVQAGEMRYGRLSAELTVTPDAYTSIPGHGDVFLNQVGETVWRKRIVVLGAPTAKVGLNVIDPTAGMLLG